MLVYGTLKVQQLVYQLKKYMSITEINQNVITNSTVQNSHKTGISL